MKVQRGTFFLATLLICAGLALPAWALELHQARASGQVGELATGYVVALQPGAGVDALVADVNAKRKTEYAKIAAQNGQSLDVVAKLAAPQIISSLEPGAPYQSTGGAWQTK